MRLTEAGLVRWYASCCNTPIGNTLSNRKLSFVGLIHNCLEIDGRSVNDALGIAHMRVNCQSAKGMVESSATALIAGLMRLAAMMLTARLTGRYRLTPFFARDTGRLIVAPKVLTADERQRLRQAVA